MVKDIKSKSKVVVSECIKAQNKNERKYVVSAPKQHHASDKR